jgi:hypothetical protein
MRFNEENLLKQEEQIEGEESSLKLFSPFRVSPEKRIKLKFNLISAIFLFFFLAQTQTFYLRS